MPSTFSRVGNRWSKLWPSMGPKYRKPSSSNSNPGSTVPLANARARLAILCIWPPMRGILPSAHRVSPVTRSKSLPVMIRFR